MIECPNHSGVAADVACVACSRPFCAKCMTERPGGAHCADCAASVPAADACPNHPAVVPTVGCVGCRRTYCTDCTVQYQGYMFCGPCKNRAVRFAQMRSEFSLPREALLFSLVGLLCWIVLEPIAIVKAVQALGMIKRDPSLPGKGEATAALVIGLVICAINIVPIVLYVIAIVGVGMSEAMR